MSCVLFFNFVLLLFAIALLILGTATSRWLVIDNNPPNNVTSEHSNGILSECKRLYRQSDADDYFTVNNIRSRKANILHDDAYVCSNRLFKWYDSSVNGSELSEHHKVLIGLSLACVSLSIIALLTTQLINTNASFQNFGCAKRMIECLLIFDILTVALALITLALFLGYERLQPLTSYGFSFWSFVAGTCCIFISCILTAVYRIDVEFEFRRYRHESVATLC